MTQVISMMHSSFSCGLEGLYQMLQVPAGDAARANGMAQSQKSMPPASPLSLDPLNMKEASKSSKEQ